MAAIVRVKRRREDDVVDSLVLLCKKAKSLSASDSTVCSSDEVKSVFKFAGTVAAKEGTVATQCVSQAIRKAKLQKQYKLTERQADLRSRSQLRQSDASCSRYKIVAERRALDFASLAVDHDANSKSLDTDVSESKTDLTPTASAPNSRVFCLYDVEKLEFKSVSQIADAAAAAASSNITCNNIPLVRETVTTQCRTPSLAVPEEVSTSDEMGHYVYDVYYMNDAQFDFKALENVLAVESFREEEPLMYDYASDEEDEEAGYDDEDDENAENNWRNDYPDHDPMYFERLHLDDNYSSDDDSVDRCYKDDEDAEDKY